MLQNILELKYLSDVDRINNSLSNRAALLVIIYLTSSSFGISTLRKLYVDNVLNRLDVPTVSSDVRDNNELNVSHGIPENFSVVSEAFGNTVNTIVDTDNCHTGSNSASLP